MSTASLVREDILAALANEYPFQGDLTDARGVQDATLGSGSEVYVDGPGGLLPQAIYIDGTQLVETSASVGNFDTDVDWTIGGWFKPDDPTTNGALQRLFDKQLGSNPFDGLACSFRGDTNYSVQLAVVRTPANQYVVQVDNPWSEDDTGFKHIVVQFFGATTDDFRCFINGVEQTLNDIGEDDRPLSTGAVNGVPFAWGSSQNFSSNRDMAGAMAGCFVADWILSPEQVNVLYEAAASADNQARSHKLPAKRSHKLSHVEILT